MSVQTLGHAKRTLWHLNRFESDGIDHLGAPKISNLDAPIVIQQNTESFVGQRQVW